jgi:hypothetical protein
LITIVTILVTIFPNIPASNAETVELKTGQQIDGAVKIVTSTDVQLDVAGQPLTLPREKVAAIYFGAKPRTTASGSPSATKPLSEALQVLKGLQSATNAGVSYRDYAPRVTDAKIQADRLLGNSPEGAAKADLVTALEFYVYASNAWNAHISGSNYAAIGTNPLADKCALLTQTLASLGSHASGSDTKRGIAISIVGIEPLFKCASERISEAEHLVRPG